MPWLLQPTPYVTAMWFDVLALFIRICFDAFEFEVYDNNSLSIEITLFFSRLAGPSTQSSSFRCCLFTRPCPASGVYDSMILTQFKCEMFYER